MAKNNETETQTQTEETPFVSKYEKQQILKSEKYSNRRDLLSALLKDGEQYTHEEIAALIDGFMKGTVKMKGTVRK